MAIGFFDSGQGLEPSCLRARGQYMVKYSERAHLNNFPIQLEALKVMVIRYVLYSQEKLPNVPIAGMYNKYGGKVRLTFKLELDQVWIGTKGTLLLHVLAL